MKKRMRTAAAALICCILALPVFAEQDTSLKYRIETDRYGKEEIYRYYYSDDGRRLEVWGPDGYTVDEYDEKGRNIHHKGTSAGNESFKEYNEDGKLVYEYSNASIFRYTYDDQGRVCHVEKSTDTRQGEQLDAIHEYEYSEDGLHAHRTIYRPDGSNADYETDFTYDEAGHTIREDTNYEGRIETVIREYDEQGHILRDYMDSWVNWKEYLYEYDEEGHRTIYTENSEGATITRRYEYDENGNRVKEYQHDISHTGNYAEMDPGEFLKVLNEYDDHGNITLKYTYYPDYQMDSGIWTGGYEDGGIDSWYKLTDYVYDYDPDYDPGYLAAEGGE